MGGTPAQLRAAAVGQGVREGRGERKGKKETDKATDRHRMESNVGTLDKARQRGREDIGSEDIG